MNLARVSVWPSLASKLIGSVVKVATVFAGSFDVDRPEG